MTTTTYDFTKLGDLLKSAGITIAEASKIFKASRPTIYSWVAGNAPTQELLLRNTERLIAVIERAVTAGSLPLVDAEKEARVPEIMTRLRKHLNGAS